VRLICTFQVSESFLNYFRCPAECCAFEPLPELGRSPGFFAFGPDLLLFGRSAIRVKCHPTDELQDAATKVQVNDGCVRLPFDVPEIVANFQFERYVCPEVRGAASKLVRDSYYGIRPILPPWVRRHFQKLYFRGWRDIKFPKWPIDDTLDRLYRDIMGRLIRARGEEIPFIWFWPDSHLSCCILTHDVEHQPGLQFSLELLRIDQEYGFRSSFQLVPEQRYDVPLSLLEKIRSADFEVNVHDINHDGHLFRDYEEFQRRAKRINQYAKEWGAKGFRAGSMYRNLDWIKELNFDYDMSCPTAAHLEPQRGGCCSIMPFSVGAKIELPLTMTQDYTLYYIMGSYSTELWERELETLIQSNGLIAFNIHPDYVVPSHARRVYVQLLRLLHPLIESKRVWQALPRDVARWWQQRSRLTLVKQGSEWRICGEGAEKAQLAFAYVQDEQVRYRMQTYRSMAR
jgi:hypothetical protein